MNYKEETILGRVDIDVENNNVSVQLLNRVIKVDDETGVESVVSSVPHRKAYTSDMKEEFVVDMGMDADRWIGCIVWD